MATTGIRDNAGLRSSTWTDSWKSYSAILFSLLLGMVVVASLQ